MEYIGIDIFSGAGGLSLGAEWAGVNVKIAIEKDKSAAETYKLNHKEATVLCDDIKDINAQSLIGDQPVFIIMGGPPCQGFSLSNTMSRNMDNPNNHLFEEFLRFVKDIKPKWFLFENVWGFTKMEDGKTETYVQHRFEELGYKVSPKVLWANDYGVPQRRNRFFMVGNLDDIDFEYPKPVDYQVTVEQAIGDLPVLENGDSFESLEYSKSLEQASNYAQIMRRKSKKALQNYVSKNNDLVTLIPQLSA